MSRLNSLLAALPRSLSRDPKEVAGLTLSKDSGSIFEVRDGYLTSTPVNGTALHLPLRTNTIGTLATAVAAVTGYAATALQPGINALALLDGVYDGSGGRTVTLYYYTSGTYRALAPIGLTLDDIDAAIAEVVSQMDMRQADGIWLDRWGTLYGISRTSGENDFAYARRMNESVIAAKMNGNAIILTLTRAAGASGATITDSGPAAFTVNLTLSDSAQFPYSTDVLNGLIRTYKAFGTQGVLNLSTEGSETFPAINVVDSYEDTQAFGINQFGADEFGLKEF